MARDEILAAGYALQEQGRKVFMLGRAKRPVANCPDCRDAGPDHDREACGHLLCHAAYAGTIDPARFAAMVDAVPGGMLAERTGAAGGIVVIDIDSRNGGQVIPDLMPRTQLMFTGSDDPHLVYRHPGVRIPNSQSLIGPGIDVRGEGGYHAVPPSRHPRTGRAYRWAGDRPTSEMPAALIAACQPTPAVTVSTGTRTTSTTSAPGISRPERLLAAILDRVEQAPEGSRRVTLYGAARGVARMVAVGCLTRDDAWRALTEAGEQAQQTARDIRRAVEAGFTAEGVNP